MKFQIFLATISILISTYSNAAQTLKLAQNGRALYDIVLADSPAEVEQTAAKELKAHLDIAGSADFKILKKSEKSADSKNHSIYVGKTESAKKFLVENSSFDKLEYDSIFIKTDNADIVLFGHPQRGALYAAYTLLEDFIGVRWWSATEDFIPQKQTLEIDAPNIEYAPKFKTREALYRIAFDGIFASKMKQNGATLTRGNFERDTISSNYGGCNNLVLFRGRGSSFHSYFEILPPSKYFEKHPDWYSLIKGKRVYKNAQLCLANKKMFDEFLKNVKKLLRENPKATAIQISQNDNRNPCECDECKAVENENGGAHSAATLAFANKIAEAIQDDFPNVYVDTFAYQYTRKAPTKIVPRKNVLVRLCSIECSFLQTIDSPENKKFADDLKEWSKLTDNLFIWDYVTCFPSFMTPHPNMRVLAENIRFFAAHNVAGIFEQGDAFCIAGDFVLLRNWVISHLMWNPQLDEKKLFDEFLFGYYGKDVGTIFKEYLKLICDCAESKKVRLSCFNKNTLIWLDLDTFNQSVILMNKALSAAEKLEKENPEKFGGLVKKVKREKISIDHTALVYYPQLKELAEKEGKKCLLPADPAYAARKLVALWNELGVQAQREFDTPEKFAAYCDSLISKAEKFSEEKTPHK